MKRNKQLLLLIVALLLILTAGAALLAQSSASYNLDWHVIGSGGSESNSASYRVNGTVGQSLASPPESGSASFEMSSGYWVLPPFLPVYLPLITSN